MNASAPVSRERRLRALDVEPLCLRGKASVATTDPVAEVANAAAARRDEAAPVTLRIGRLALHPDNAELADPEVHKMYAALTAAVGRAGLQPVRVCDVADDPAAAVMVFGAASLPDGIPPVRVLRADPLAVLYADRQRKRLLWERMQALGRGEGG